MFDKKPFDFVYFTQFFLHNKIKGYFNKKTIIQAE